MKNIPQIGDGIFTVPDASLILSLPASKISLWLRKYWELEFIKENSNDKYTWGSNKERAFNFYTLIELITVKSLRDLNISFSKIKTAHNVLADILNSPFPFATTEILTDKRNIYLSDNQKLLGLDKKQQYNFGEIVKPYCKRLEFNKKTLLAERYWPLGKNHSIIVDPHHSFGQPVIVGTNINIWAIENLFSAGESKEQISNIYNLNISQIEDAMMLINRKAA